MWAMVHLWRGSSTARVCLLAVALLDLSSAASVAASMGFRNDTPTPVIVRGASVVNRTVRQGPPHLLQPKGVAWDRILFPGNKLITIYDAKQPSRLLYQGTIPNPGNDQFFSIQLVEPLANGTAEPKPAPPEVKLVPIPPPAPPPGSGPPRR
jgi:hypothetical protein